MHSYEFLAGLQRLAVLAKMTEETDIPGILEHLIHAETVTPMLTGVDVGVQLKDLREFAEKAGAFQRECIRFHDRLADAMQAAGRQRRQLVGPETRPPEPA